jgi:hypothetical protein
MFVPKISEKNRPLSERIPAAVNIFSPVIWIIYFCSYHRIKRNYMKKTVIFMFIIAAVLYSCNDDNLNTGETRLTFRLTDAPALYDEVNIDIIGASAIINDSTIELDVNAGVYNLLDFTNGKDTVIVDQEIPSGELSQIRLILGYNNTIVTDGNTYDLKTPSAQQSGLKLSVHNSFVQGAGYEYIIDFDAARSVVKTGNGKYILKPVIRVFTKAVSGALEGVVSPAKAKPLVYAISSQLDSLSAFADTVSGKFVFRGLTAGTYKVSVLPQNPYSDTLIKNIVVNTGLVTKMDTIRLK